MQLSGAPQEVGECAAVSMALYQHIKIRKHTHRHTFTHTYTLRGHYIDLSTIPGNLTDNILKICVCFLSTYRAQSPLIGGPID